MKDLNILSLLNGVLLPSCILFCVHAICYAPFGPDGGFYLGVVKLLSQDKSQIINLGYTPLVITFFSIIITIFKNASSSYFVTFLIFVIIGNGFLLKKILDNFTQLKSQLKWLFALLYIFLQLRMDGFYIILESVTTFFTLLAVFTQLKSNNFTNTFLAGAFCAMAFLSKQYGLAGIGIIVFILFQRYDYRFHKSFFYKALILFLGFFVGLIITYTLCSLQLFSKIVNPLEIIKSSLKYGSPTLVNSALNFFLSLIRYIPFVFIMIAGFTSLRKNKLFATALIGVLAFLPAFYFKQYAHYFHLILPFLILSIASLSFYNEKTLTDKKVKIVFLALVSLTIYANHVNAHLFDNKKRLKQKQNSTKLAQIIPKNSTVYILESDLQQYRFLNELNPPLITEYGFAFPINFTDEVQNTLKLNSEYIIALEPIEHEQFEWVETVNNSIYVYQNQDLKFDK